jgi:hypothetical protein
VRVATGRPTRRPETPGPNARPSRHFEARHERRVLRNVTGGVFEVTSSEEDVDQADGRVIDVDAHRFGFGVGKLDFS